MNSMLMDWKALIELYLLSRRWHASELLWQKATVLGLWSATALPPAPTAPPWCPSSSPRTPCPQCRLMPGSARKLGGKLPQLFGVHFDWRSTSCALQVESFWCKYIYSDHAIHTLSVTCFPFLFCFSPFSPPSHYTPVITTEPGHPVTHLPAVLPYFPRCCLWNQMRMCLPVHTCATGLFLTARLRVLSSCSLTAARNSPPGWVEMEEQLVLGRTPLPLGGEKGSTVSSTPAGRRLGSVVLETVTVTGWVWIRAGALTCLPHAALSPAVWYRCHGDIRGLSVCLRLTPVPAVQWEGVIYRVP